MRPQAGFPPRGPHPHLRRRRGFSCSRSMSRAAWTRGTCGRTGLRRRSGKRWPCWARWRGSRVGLVEFAGSARIMSPLPRPIETGWPRSWRPRPHGSGSAGNRSGPRRSSARPAFSIGRAEQPRAIVLLSDGENLEGDPRPGARDREAHGGESSTRWGSAPRPGVTIPIVTRPASCGARSANAQGNVVVTEPRRAGAAAGSRRAPADGTSAGTGTGRAGLRLWWIRSARAEPTKRAAGTIRRVRRAFPVVRRGGGDAPDRRASGCREGGVDENPARSRAPRFSSRRPAAALLTTGAAPRARGVREIKARRYDEALRDLSKGRADFSRGFGGSIRRSRGSSRTGRGRLRRGAIPGGHAPARRRGPPRRQATNLGKPRHARQGLRERGARVPGSAARDAARRRRQAESGRGPASVASAEPAKQEESALGRKRSAHAAGERSPAAEPGSGQVHASASRKRGRVHQGRSRALARVAGAGSVARAGRRRRGSRARRTENRDW